MKLKLIVLLAFSAFVAVWANAQSDGATTTGTKSMMQSSPCQAAVATLGAGGDTGEQKEGGK